MEMQHWQNQINTRGRNVVLVFLLYWFTLVFWQNINPGSTGTTEDTFIKIALLFSLILVFISKAKFRRKGAVLLFVISTNIVISYLAETTPNLRSILNYFFPLLLILICVYLGFDVCINRNQFLFFSKTIILLVLYMALYAIIDTPEKFTSPLLLENAYGNELSSFFISNHEYALYLTSAIISCLICFELDEQANRTKKVAYVLIACFLFYNLILTFSRTFLLGAVCFIVIYILLNKNSASRKIMIIMCVCACALILIVPELNNFVFEIVLKGNNLAGRDVLNEKAGQIFYEGDTLQQLWGFGASNVQEIFRDELQHAYTHNAYFKYLLYFGVIGLLSVLCFLIHRAKTCWKIIKLNRSLGIIFFALVIMASVVMFFNTCTLFFSPCDSFFLSIYTILVPMYVVNAINKGVFDERKI